jgi:hypothetical protein
MLIGRGLGLVAGHRRRREVKKEKYMELENRNKEEGKEEGKTKTEESGGLARLSATKEGDEALDRIVERLNDGFTGGKVSRMQALSFLLMRQAEDLSDALIQEVRAAFFDEVTLLESILRQAKATGKVPVELRGLLLKQAGFDEQVKKKPKKQD